MSKITGKTIRRVLIAIAGLFLIGILVRAYYDTHSIEIKRFEIENSRLGDALAGAKIAFLSDLHFREMGRLQHQITDLLNSERPDLIFIGGDLIAFRSTYEPVLTFLSGLTPRLGVYAVLGNTEYSNENGSCILCHKEGSKDLKRPPSPTFLRNSSVNLRVNGRELTLLGVDDPVTKRSDLRGTLKKMKSTHTSILLAHSPEVFEEASELGIDLVLSGHTHGGQIVLSRFLRRILPLDQTFNFIEGFFQKGKSLMYVSRGIGTSFLPFRFMVRPEISFFTFTNGRNRSQGPGRSVISNTVSGEIFAGVTLPKVIETFNVFRPSGVLRDSNNEGGSNPTSLPDRPTTLFDFESEKDLSRLNWECHKWFELSHKHVTSGRYSLSVLLPKGTYRGVEFREIPRDWSNRSYFKMDVFNPSREELTFQIRIDDHNSGWEYANRFDAAFQLKPGMNHLSIPTDNIRTNIHPHPLDLKNIERLLVFLPYNDEPREIYIDYIRLE